MSSRWHVLAPVLAVALTYACTGHADAVSREAAAKKTISAYLRAEANTDYVAMTPLFTQDARLKYTYQWGYGHPDTVYELDFSKSVNTADVLELDGVGDYEILDRKSRIEHVKAKPTGEIEASVIVKERYLYSGYEGTSNTKLELVLRRVGGAERIARLTSVTKY